jgi:hypothetical protein
MTAPRNRYTRAHWRTAQDTRPYSPYPKDGHGEGTTLTNLGIGLREMRRFNEAITVCQDAGAIFRDTGDRHREGGSPSRYRASPDRATDRTKHGKSVIGTGSQPADGTADMP